MAQGHRSLTTRYQFGDGVAGTPASITAVAVANGVATVTATGHGHQTGDVVTIAGVVGTGGMEELVNRDHLVRVVDANDFILSSFVEGAYTSGGDSTVQNTSWQEFPGVLTDEFSSEAADIAVGDINPVDGYEVYDPGLKENTWTMDMRFIPGEITQSAINGFLYFFNRGRIEWMRQIFPQRGNATPDYAAALCTFQTHTDSRDRDNAMGLTIGGRYNGPRLFISGV